MSGIKISFDPQIANMLNCRKNILELDLNEKDFKLGTVFGYVKKCFKENSTAVFLPKSLSLRNYVIVVVDGERITDPQFSLKEESTVEFCLEAIAGG